MFVQDTMRFLFFTAKAVYRQAVEHLEVEWPANMRFLLSYVAELQADLVKTFD